MELLVRPLPTQQVGSSEVPNQKGRMLPQETRSNPIRILSGVDMSTQRMRQEAKVQYLQKELEALKDYFYVPETYQYLIEQLDAQQVLLKRLEIQEQFAAIDLGDTDQES